MITAHLYSVQCEVFNYRSSGALVLCGIRPGQRAALLMPMGIKVMPVTLSGLAALYS